MRRRTLRFGMLGGSLVLAAASAGACFGLAPAAGGLQELKNVEGTVSDVIKNDRDEVDGWKLQSGELIHFPPHAYGGLRSWIESGDTVRVMAAPETLPDGREVFKAVTIQAGDRTVRIQPPAPPRPDAPYEREEEPMKAEGTIVSLHENHHGDVAGFMLSDDTEVKFPPHNWEALLEGMKVGDEAVVKGRRHETPEGDVHLHAEEITAGGFVYTIDRPKPPKHGHEDWMTRRQADDLLEEVRAIRELLTKRAE